MPSPIYSKPYQEALQMIREGFVLAIEDATQGPLLIDALREALKLPYIPIDISSPAVTLSNDHLGAILELLAPDTVVTLPAQSEYDWSFFGAIITLRSEFPFTLATSAGIEVNGVMGSIWNCEEWPKAVTINRRETDIWGLTGAATLATP